MQQVLETLQISFDELPNFLKVLANSMPVLKAYIEIDQSLTQGLLPSAAREQIALAVAEINGSSYSISAHAVAAEDAGLTKKDIQLARRSAAFDPKTNAMLRFAQKLVLQRGKVSDKDISALGNAGFSQAELLEIAANVVLNIFTNYINLIAKTEADFPTLEPVSDSRNGTANVPQTTSHE